MLVYSLPLGRKELEVCGDGNCLYRSVALAVNGESDLNFGHIREMCNEVMIENPATFRQYLFRHKLMEKHLERSIMSGAWRERVDI